MKLKILFFPIALIAAFVITILFTKPEWDIYKDKQEELNTLVKELGDLESGHNSILTATKKLDTLTSDQESLVLNTIPNNNNDDDFLAEVHKSAERSGVFIISTKVKNDDLSKSSKSLKALSGEAKPSLKTTNVKVTIMGSYTDVAEFIKEVDSHNRITIPKELSIVAQEVSSSSGEGDPEMVTSGMLVRCDVDFDFFNKAENQKLQIASLIRTDDPVIKSLLSGQFKTDVIEKYKEDITSEIFRPVGAGNAGKNDIFSN